ncbi:MAG TPA: hypothetical protein VHF45_01345 [Thermoleophilaceae bacterium]|nr:hypothetical protein [Thermoleophilaceae bacterium]
MADEEDAVAGQFADLLAASDTPLERVRLARAVIASRASGRLDAKLAAAALIDLTSDSTALLGASLVAALAVSAGVARTPAGVVLAA